MNYRHIYHAGSFSDLIKHITLIAVLNSLRKKEKPFAVLDAFAGLGVYDLTSEQSVKTEESKDGIGKVLESPVDHPLLVQFVDIVRSLEQSHYPGSPWIISSLLREGDRLIASELHPQDYAHLRYLFSKTKNVAVHLLDAYNAVKAFLPFKENRGLIFLDPPFEAKNEFDKLVSALKIINHRAANICSMIWYPIKDAKPVQNFYKNCHSIGFKEILIIEFEIKNPLIEGLTKCGILITNPPFIHEEIKSLLEYLKKNTYQNQAEFKIYSPSVY
jgi:23S rRNA (adenine2030-N6)-methyltransferase